MKGDVHGVMLGVGCSNAKLDISRNVGRAVDRMAEYRRRGRANFNDVRPIGDGCPSGRGGSVRAGGRREERGK